MSIQLPHPIQWTVLLGLSALFALTSCDSASLEENDVGGANEALYSTASGFNAGVGATYRRARAFYGVNPGVALSVVGTDTWANGAHGNWPKVFNYYNEQLNPEVGQVGTPWINFYRGINTANTVLDHTDEVEGLSQDVIDTRVGEVKFMRGFYYFMLMRLYGPVPLNVEPVRGIVEEEERAPMSEIYDFIIQDLNDAIAALPAEQDEWGRATRGAARHLLAEVYLEHGYDMDEPSSFSEAASLAEQVIDSGQYRLLDNYSDWFALDNEENEEVIWAVQYSANQRFNGDGNLSHLFFNAYYELNPGLTRDLENGRPWIRVKPTGFLIDSYDHENSSRYQESFKDVFYVNDPGTYEIDGREVELAAGDTAVWFVPPNVPPSEYEDANYTVYTPDQYYQDNIEQFPVLRKHIDPRRNSLNDANGTRDLQVFRLAHTYLVAAEARFQMGDAAQAAQHLNVVRERVAFPGRESAMTVSAGDVTIDYILDEWGRETAGEYRRFFDLARTERLIERVRAYGEAAENIQEFHSLYPIPQSQIDALGGSEAFAQNAGY